jgi:hypothetical protein
MRTGTKLNDGAPYRNMFFASVTYNNDLAPFQHLQPGGPGVFHRGNIGFLVPAWSCFAKKREATRKLWQVIRLPNGV